MQQFAKNSEENYPTNSVNKNSFLPFNLSYSGSDIASYSILFFSVVFGFFFRLKGLGKWPLAVDEYYIVKSVENILKYGLPQFDSGGYYVRGIIYQYITAGLVLTGMKIEFAARLFPVISNMLVIPPLYMLGKKISGKLFAAVLVAVFCFSVWEIEMARFARMYAPFQALFIYYLLCMYEYIVEDKQSRKKWIYILSFLSIFTHEASIFLVIFNFVPILWGKKFRFSDISLSILLFIFAYLYLSFNFRNYNNGPLLPPDITIPQDHSSVLNLPVLLIFTVFRNAIPIIFFLAVTVFSVFSITNIFLKLNDKLFTKLSYLVLVLLSLLHLFGLMIFILLIAAAINWINLKQIKEKPVKLISFALVINFIYWLVFTIITMKREYNGVGFLKPAKETIKILFKYPNFDVLTIYLHTIPLFTIAAGLLLGLALITVILGKDPKNYEKRFLLFSVLSLLLLITLVNINYNETRYTFFLFPIILLLILSEIENLTNTILGSRYTRQWVFILPILLFLAISEDFNLHHILKIDDKTVNYRIGLNENLAYHYYFRWDERTPAEIINKNFKNGNIVITDSPISEFYLNHLDYYYNDYRNRNFINISTYRGTRDRWSNVKLIYRNSDLLKMINERKSTVWLIVDKNIYLKELSFYDSYKKNLYYTTIEGKLQLYKFP